MSGAVRENVDFHHPALRMKTWKIYVESKQPSDAVTIPKRTGWHYHEEFEVVAVLEGNVDFKMKNREYRLEKGDIVIAGSNQLHKTHCSRGSVRIVLQLDLNHHFDQSIATYWKCFSEIHHPLSELNYVFEETVEARQEALQTVIDIYRESCEQTFGYEVAINMLIKKLLLVILRYDHRGLLQEEFRPKALELKPILDYIESHLSEKINVADVCRLVNLSYFYFSRCFKDWTGMNFTDYILHKRIKMAERLLLTTSMSIGETAEKAGIPNLPHFYASFKKINHCSPSEFRRKMLS
jgi:AraC-like DNA-binding protein/mannose-6-phosphate isomerase-like protein (cupin superfamily)